MMGDLGWVAYPKNGVSMTIAAIDFSFTAVVVTPNALMRYLFIYFFYLILKLLSFVAWRPKDNYSDVFVCFVPHNTLNDISISKLCSLIILEVLEEVYQMY